MTWDEVEKAIQFLLDSQARNDAQIGQLSSRLDQLTGDVSQLRGAVSELGGQVGELTNLVGRLAESTRVFVERVNGRFAKVETTLAEMTDKLNALIGIVERHVTDENRHRRRPS
jgi:uncharacterized protein YoxC